MQQDYALYMPAMHVAEKPFGKKIFDELVRLCGPRTLYCRLLSQRTEAHLWIFDKRPPSARVIGFMHVWFVLLKFMLPTYATRLDSVPLSWIRAVNASAFGHICILIAQKSCADSTTGRSSNSQRTWSVTTRRAEPKHFGSSSIL